uniref:TATA box-binding protein-associated factor RNA polymerase I subunit B n=1 Tax=Mola mola TaxID=94237 RepID=A0A3Q3XJY7_MOLML
MDEQAGYTEPCAQCSAVDWGVSDEGCFYCRSCHNVIERSREVVDTAFTHGSSRISTISKGRRTKSRQWMICEGFQFILRNQADALLRLGVSAHMLFQDRVLCQLWRLYLQKSRQAYTHAPVTSSQFKLVSSPTESSCLSANETDTETNPSCTSCSDWSLCSDSMDTVTNLSARGRRSCGLMSMRRTLALIHLALIWSREALTLSDLLRLVSEGHVPYVNAYEELPDEMKLAGKDSLLFRVESFPSHGALHKEAETLLLFLQLPAFPPISCHSQLHPALLSLRYLTDANLPDELHPWVCRLMERAGLGDEALHTCGCSARPVLPRYDVQTAAIIVVTMKLLFGLDDLEDQFNLRRWYRLMQAALIRAQIQRRDDIVCVHSLCFCVCVCVFTLCVCVCSLFVCLLCVFVFTFCVFNVCVCVCVCVWSGVAEQLRLCFEKLSSRPAGVQHAGPSTFRFCWGDENGADGPSLHQKKLDGVVTRTHGLMTPRNTTYWHPALRTCKSRCRSHYTEVEATLPRTFVWLMKVFCFLLDVKPASLYEEVLRVERRVFGKQRSRSPVKRYQATRAPPFQTPD